MESFDYSLSQGNITCAESVERFRILVNRRRFITGMLKKGLVH